MALKNKFVDPKIYKNKIYFLLVLFAMDILGSSFTQFFGFGSTNTEQYYGLTYKAPDGALAYTIFT